MQRCRSLSLHWIDGHRPGLDFLCEKTNLSAPSRDQGLLALSFIPCLKSWLHRSDKPPHILLDRSPHEMAADLTTFERLLIPGAPSFAVPSQGDEPYRSVSQNQCGWCAAGFGARSRDLGALWATGDEAGFRSSYAAALQEASEARAVSMAAPGFNPSGENVDHAALMSFFSPRVEPVAVAGVAGGAGAAAELHVALKDLSFYPPYEVTEWFVRPREKAAPAAAAVEPAVAAAAAPAPAPEPMLSGEELAAALEGTPIGCYVTIGRFHEAFCGYRIAGDRWLAMDSHVRRAGEMTTAAFLTYVRFEIAGPAYSCVVFQRGRQKAPG